MRKWSDRPRDERASIIGAAIGMGIAAVIAIAFASDSSTIVRYLIMSAGLLLGLGAGKLAASRP